MNKTGIERTLFWFKHENENLLSLDDRFFGHATLLNRLLNESYNGKKIKFINLDFWTEESFQMFPQIEKNYTHYYSGSGGHLRHWSLFDLDKFDQLNEIEQTKFIWAIACENLSEASKLIKNQSLLESCSLAYVKGMKNGLNPDYKMVESDVILYGEMMKAAIWVNFKRDGMYSKLTLEKAGVTFFERQIDVTKNGIEFFLEMYKSIEVVGNTIIVKGHKDVDYLPLQITIDKNTVQI